MAVTIVRAPQRLTAAQRKAATTLYLAGPFGGPWRDRVMDAVGNLDVTVIDPRSDRWPELAAGSAGRRGAYEWQCTMAYDADVVVAWAPEESEPDPTSLLILGYLAARRGTPAKGNTVLVGGGGASGLIRLFAQNQRLTPVDGDLDEVIRLARLRLESVTATKSST